MIPLTSAEIEALGSPGDVLRRATLEPFHFDWSAVPNELSADNHIYDVKLDEYGRVQIAYSACDASTFSILTLDEAGNASQVVNTIEPYTCVGLHNGNYYYSTGASVWKDGEIVAVVDNEIEQMAVVADDEFYFHYTTVQNIDHLLHYDGTRTIESGIHWCANIKSMSAVRLDEHDVVLVSGELPSYLTASSVTGSIVWSKTTSEGIVSFVVNTASGDASMDMWSDHYNVETNETDTQKFWRMTAYKTHDNKVGVVYIVTVHGSRTVLTSLSRDGRSWCLPIPLEHPSSEWTPFLAVSSDKVYAISKHEVWSSPGFELFGVEPDALDITPYVNECSVTNDQRTGVDIALNLVDSVWNLLESGSVLLRLYAGYIYDSDASVEKLIFTGENDMHAKQYDYVPNQSIMLRFRDITSWLDRTTSPITVEADGGTALLETYGSDLGVGFGGLSRTAAYRGSWETEDGALVPLSDGVNLALSTTGNNVNGMASVEATIEDTANDVVGIAYRAVTDNILLALLYRNGYIILQRRNGEETTALDYLQHNLGLSPKLRVEYRYGLHRGYYSTDGHTWVQAVEKIMYDHCYYGAVGLLAEQVVAGYVPDPWEPPDWEPPFIPPIVPPEPTDWPTIAWVFAKKGVYVTTNFSGTDTLEQPDWTADHAGLPDIFGDEDFWLVIAAHNSENPYNQVCCVHDNSTSYPGDDTLYARSSGGVWSESLNEEDAETVAGATGPVRFRDLIFNKYDGYFYALYSRASSLPFYILRSSTGLSGTWERHTALEGGTFLYHAKLAMFPGITAVGLSLVSGTNRVYISTDGETWNNTPTMGGSSWPVYPAFSSDGTLYCPGNGINGPDLMLVYPGGSAEVIGDGLGMGYRYHAGFWGNPQSGGHCRSIAYYDGETGNNMFVTYDAWESIVEDREEFDVESIQFIFTPVPSYPNRIVFGRFMEDIGGSINQVYVCDEEYGELISKSGSGLTAIPNEAGGMIDNGFAAVDPTQ